jgi:hypothetical protein
MVGAGWLTVISARCLDPCPDGNPDYSGDSESWHEDLREEAVFAGCIGHTIA